MSDEFKGSPLVVEDLDVTLRVVHYKVESDSKQRGPTIRSCWVCNPAHEHLRSSKWLFCFVCNRSYREGVEEVPCPSTSAEPSRC